VSDVLDFSVTRGCSVSFLGARLSNKRPKWPFPSKFLTLRAFRTPTTLSDLSFGLEDFSSATVAHPEPPPVELTLCKVV